MAARSLGGSRIVVAAEAAATKVLINHDLIIRDHAGYTLPQFKGWTRWPMGGADPDALSEDIEHDFQERFERQTGNFNVQDRHFWIVFSEHTHTENSTLCFRPPPHPNTR